MGNEKRLFLLAVMTVLMSTAGYGAKIEFNASPEEQYIENVKPSDTYQLNAGKENEKTKVTNKAEITIKSGTGINLYNKNSKGENIFTNEGKITIKGGTGIQIGKNGTVVNDKEIIVENGKGIQFNTNNETAAFINKGTMTVKKGQGVFFKADKDAGGLFVNYGTINAEGQTAVESKFNNGKAADTTTVYLKSGSTLKGNIVGNALGYNILGLEKGKYDKLYVSDYDTITVRNGDVEITNSDISLNHNNNHKKEDKEKFLNDAKDKMDKVDKEDGITSSSGDLTISDSNLSINLSGNPNKVIDADSLTFNGNISLKFNGIAQSEYDVNKILGLNKIESSGANFEKTVIWSYDNNDGQLTARKKDYNEIINKSQLKDFAEAFQNTTETVSGTGLYTKAGEALESLKTEEEFNRAITQLSGGLHGYTVDIAAVNSRTLSNTMKERALTRDYLIKRPVSSWTQDIMYIDNNHRFGGLMDVDYKETGAMGISEKQILSNGRIGLVYGGSSGKADASEYGNIDVDTAYFGGYYNHEFNDKWSLNSNANFVYTHNKVTRNINFGEEKKVNRTFKSNYPTYTVGVGSSLIYTVKDDLYNKAHFYAGIDVNRIMQGMITEDEDYAYGNEKAEELAVRRKGAANDKSYYSIVPSAGFMVQNTGYIFDKKYRIGADLNWETEVGNIKDGKRLHMKGISSEYKVETTERENIFSYSLFGALNLTEDLAVNAKYTSMFSDEYDADMVSAGFEYKMDTMGDNGIFGPIFYGLENHKPKSDRWAGTFSLMLENEDPTDRTYWNSNGKLVSGDYATSNEYKPKFTLSLNDKETNWAYYFEGYYKSNDFIKNPKENEEASHASRIHGEARWSDTYSKGRYGINIGYRNETSNKPSFSYQKNSSRIQRGVHQLRLTPNFTYELGNGFTFTGKTTGIFEYNYTGPKDGQMDFLLEGEYGIVYTGFMPRWRMSLVYFRDDRWYDNSNLKITGYKDNGEMKTEFYTASARYQLGQIRPSITYYFGNGGSFKFDVRVPLGNGQWYNDKNGTKAGEAYEVRYGFNYYHPVTPGLMLNVGGTFLNIKNKVKDHSKDTYGEVTRSYTFRPNIGFSYSF